MKQFFLSEPLQCRRGFPLASVLFAALASDAVPQQIHRSWSAQADYSIPKQKFTWCDASVLFWPAFCLNHIVYFATNFSRI